MTDTITNPTTGKTLRTLFFIAVALGCAMAMAPSVTGPDLWGHVQYGRDVLADGEIPATTTYSFTAQGYRWINHENLAEILLAVGADTIGATGLAITKCLLSLFVIVLILWNARRQGAGVMTASAVALLVAVNLAFHWSVRPQLLSYVYFTLLVVLLNWCFRGWRGQWHLPTIKIGSGEVKQADLQYSHRRMRLLWLASILFLFWANSHGGFVAGYCLYVAYLSCRTLEVIVQKGRDGLGMVRRLILMIVVAGLATLVNPYGPGLHRWLLESLTTPRPEIIEWAAPELWTLDSVKLWLLVGLFVASLAMIGRRYDFTHMVLMLLTLWQSLEHQRHLPFFAILFGFWMPRHVELLFRQLRISRDDEQFDTELSPVMRRLVLGGVCGALVLLGGRLYFRVSDLKVDRASYPVAAMQYIEDRGLSGRMVVSYNWAQYVIAAFGAESADDHGIQVAFDGRFRTCYPQEIVDMHFDLLQGDGSPTQRWRSPNSPPVDGGRVLKFKEPDLVLLNRFQPHSTKVMQEHRDQWTLLYQDGLAQLWGKRSKYDEPHSAGFIQPSDRIINNDEQTGYASWPAMPIRRARGEKWAFAR